MAANFIPPIPIGQFRPSSEAIASWLYEVWKYLQEHPIPTQDNITGAAEQVAENYVAVNVPPMIAAAVSSLSYAQFVNGTTLPIYRAANDEIDNQDLLEAWDEGCRFVLVDDEDFYIMIKNGNVITLLQVLTEQQAEGVVSVNGYSGVVVLKTSDLQNDSGYITSSGAPVQSVNGQTGAVVISNATANAAGLMSAQDKTALDGLAFVPFTAATVNSQYCGTGTCKYMKLGKIVIVNMADITFNVASGNGDSYFTGLPFAKSDAVFILQSLNTQLAPVRMVIQQDTSYIQNLYSPVSGVTPSGQEYYGQLIYETY